MGKVKDMTGKKFGRLTVLGPAPRPENSKSTHQFWLCLCDCRNQTVVDGGELRKGRTKSCGCLRKEAITKHGLHNTRLYRIYYSMINRCYNPNNKAYKYYGLRCITISPEFLGENGFRHFAEWALKNGYNDSLTLDRINPNGNYEISNLRWTTNSTQVFNRRLRSNKTGHKGIRKAQSGKYQARISKNNKQYNLGTFSTIEEAVEARQKAERELYLKN